MDTEGPSCARERGEEKEKWGLLSVISGGTQLWAGVDASASHVEEKCAFSSQMHIAQRCSEPRPTPKPYQEKESLFGPMFVCSGLYPE